MHLTSAAGTAGAEQYVREQAVLLLQSNSSPHSAALPVQFARGGLVPQHTALGSKGASMRVRHRLLMWLGSGNDSSAAAGFAAPAATATPAAAAGAAAAQDLLRLVGQGTVTSGWQHLGAVLLAVNLAVRALLAVVDGGLQGNAGCHCSSSSSCCTVAVRYDCLVSAAVVQWGRGSGWWVQWVGSSRCYLCTVKHLHQ